MVKITTEKKLIIYYQKNMIEMLENSLLTICETLVSQIKFKAIAQGNELVCIVNLVKIYSHRSLNFLQLNQKQSPQKYKHEHH